jgi:uncharacterized protein
MSEGRQPIWPGDGGAPITPMRRRTKVPRPRIPRRLFRIVATTIAALVLVGTLRSPYVVWLWFESVDFLDVYRQLLLVRLSLFIGGFALAAVVIALNVRLAYRLAPSAPEVSFIPEIEVATIRRFAAILLTGAVVLLTMVFAAAAESGWRRVVLWLNGRSFGVDDPELGRDASFYVFQLPALRWLHGWLLGLLFTSALLAAAVYAFVLTLRGPTAITRRMRAHPGVLAGLLMLTIAVGTYLRVFDLLRAAGGIVYGATYADVQARVSVLTILAVLGVLVGLAIIANGWLSAGFRLPVVLVSLCLLLGLVGGGIYPQVIQTFRVEPNELHRERPYIERNIEFTRAAWGLDQIVESQFPAATTLTVEEVEANQVTLDNIRLLDPRPLRDTMNQVQSIRSLYFFHDIDVDRYEIGGRTRQVMISARELDVGRTVDVNWTRERLQLTRGFGGVITPVHDVEPEEGLPLLLTKDVPPRGDEIPITVDGARIYFGELTEHYVVVDSDEQEFDYPSGRAS